TEHTYPSLQLPRFQLAGSRERHAEPRRETHVQMPPPPTARIALAPAPAPTHGLRYAHVPIEQPHALAPTAAPVAPPVPTPVRAQSPYASQTAPAVSKAPIIPAATTTRPAASVNWDRLPQQPAQVSGLRRLTPAHVGVLMLLALVAMIALASPGAMKTP